GGRDDHRGGHAGADGGESRAVRIPAHSTAAVSVVTGGRCWRQVASSRRALLVGCCIRPLLGMLGCDALGRPVMTTAVQQLLNSSDALPEGDKHQAAVEILRRVSVPVDGDLPAAALVEAADELFRALDTEEACHAPR